MTENSTGKLQRRQQRIQGNAAQDQPGALLGPLGGAGMNLRQ
jgi:hypothetical protein